jgi:hypothetical protein
VERLENKETQRTDSKSKKKKKKKKKPSDQTDKFYFSQAGFMPTEAGYGEGDDAESL